MGALLWGSNAQTFRERAARLEALGFGSFSVGDHLGYYAPLTACAVIAEATQTAQVGPLVLNNDFRLPAVLAAEAAALAELSGGRFELGVGAGYARREYVRSGVAYEPAATRIARLAEAAQILSGLLAGETVTMDGLYYQTQEDSLPCLGHRVPLLIGGNSPAVHAVAARSADIVNLVGLSSVRGGTAEDMSDFGVEALDRQVTALGVMRRDVEGELERHVLVQWHEVTDDRRRAGERAAESLGLPVEIVLGSPYVLIGSPDEIAAQIHDHHDTFGIARWTVFADRPELPPAEALGPVLSILSAS